MNNCISLNNKKTFWYRFNPTLKVICSIILIALAFIPTTFIFQLLILILVIVLWINSRLSFRKFKPILISTLTLLFFVLLINWLVNKNPGIKFDLEKLYQLWGTKWSQQMPNVFKFDNYYWTHGYLWGGNISNVLVVEKPISSYVSIKVNGQTLYLAYSAPWYALSSDVLINTLSTMSRIFIMFMIFSLLVNTTTSFQLTDAFYHILYPLKWIKVPVSEISYIIATAIGFIPNLFIEANKILKTQASRGLDFKNGRFIERLKALKTLVVPLFVLSFNKADKLADAMESKNFNPSSKRTKYRKYSCTVPNWIVLSILIILLGLFIYLTVCKVIIYPFISIDCFNI